MNPNVPIRQIMTREVIAVKQNDPLVKILETFQKYDFHHLPVVESRVLVGIISKEDFYRTTHTVSLNTSGKTWSIKEYGRLKAKDIMSKKPVYLDPDDSIGLAADIFLANAFHALPIVEEGKLLGIVTTHDILEYCFN